MHCNATPLICCTSTTAPGCCTCNHLLRHRTLHPTRAFPLLLIPAVFNPCANTPSVGYTEEAAQTELSGTIDVYVSKFKPMKYTLSGRDEKTIMKLIVHADTDRVVGCHM